MPDGGRTPWSAGGLQTALLVLLLVVAIRVPFLNQAIQGDDVNYLTAAQYAQIDPLHPGHAKFVFQGAKVTMQGHPHPPGNAWYQSAILALTCDIQEPVYHGAYILFSLVAALSALTLAQRFTSHPLPATLLFLVTPAFFINGNSLESDLPFLAFWLATIAAFITAVDRRSPAYLALAAVTTPLAAMCAFQSVLLTPLLGLYLWQHRRDWRPAWLIIFVAPLTLISWQLFEKLASEQLPAAVLAGYFQSYGLQRLANKARNAAALTTHLGWIVLPLAFLTRSLAPVAIAAAVAGALIDYHPLFWIPFASGITVLTHCIQNRRNALAQWILLFFAAALVLFYAGSARYLLPLALPVCLLAAQRASAKLLYPAIALYALLGVALTTVNYQHWDAYRTLVTRLSNDWENRRVWVNGEWGLRFYAESAGALPIIRGQAMRPGDLILTSKLALPVDFTTGGGALAPIEESTLTSAIPLRLIGLNSRSGYSSADHGFRAFDITRHPFDLVTLQAVTAKAPTLSHLPMNAPDADSQIVSGVDKLEENRYRWMSGRAVLLLKRPASASKLTADLFVPDQAPARRITFTIDGTPAGVLTITKPGPQHFEAPAPQLTKDPITLVIEADRTFQSPGDQRTLGVILVSAGFPEP
ncbi:MAG: glycosyltransferase family 39 protein [Bryobacterales bacterium]|nr:glycosyltransferase family 39 protein [Bryobacterales bacterium]